MVRISQGKGQLLEGMVWHNLTYLTINFSAILKRIGVTEIECKSDNEAGCDNLGTGVTIAVSHASTKQAIKTYQHLQVQKNNFKAKQACNYIQEQYS